MGYEGAENDPVKTTAKHYVPNGYEQLYKLERWHRIMLRRQHRADRRKFPPRYLWIFKSGDVEINDTYEEIEDEQRTYYDPVSTMFFVNAAPGRKEMKTFGVELIEDGGQILCEMSEAERLRLAVLFFPDNPECWPDWRPPPGSLFVFDERFYQVDAFRGKDYYGTSRQISNWIMSSSLYRNDSSAMQEPPVPIPAEPPTTQKWDLLGWVEGAV